jgi:hypothetical protein
VNSRFLAGPLLLALAAAAPIAAEAADGIKPGKWEYTITTQMPNLPNLPQLPPGVQLPPNVQMGAGGLSATHTSCVTASDPAAELSKPRGPGAAQSRCNVERMNRSGGTISWVTACTMPDGTSHSEGTARYSGDRREATTKTRTSRGNGPPMEVSNHVVGRYLGPCDGR